MSIIIRIKYFWYISDAEFCCPDFKMPAILSVNFIVPKRHTITGKLKQVS